MNNKQYNNVIEKTAKLSETDMNDSLALTRDTLNNMGVPLPQGELKEVSEILSTNDYMYWRACSAEDAQLFANDGIAAIAVSDSNITILTAETDNPTTTRTVSATETANVSTVSEVSYYAYSSSSTNASYDDAYYINNKSFGSFLHKSTNCIDTKNGRVSELQNTIEWLIEKVDSVYSVIRAANNDSVYLGVPSTSSSDLVVMVTLGTTTIPDRCLWRQRGANGGGVTFKNKFNSKYLQATASMIKTSAGAGTMGTTDFDSKVWRLAKVSDYIELNTFTVENASIDIGQPINPVINTNSGVYFRRAVDFVYSSSPHITIDHRAGTLIGALEGTATITATHKVTRQTATFTITVSNHLKTISCMESHTGWVYSDVGVNIDRAFDGVTWESSDTSVATVNSSGIATGIRAGYAIISGTNPEGKIVLMCELKVMNEISEMLRNFSPNEIEYLYCPTTNFSQFACNLEKPFEFKVKVINAFRPYFALDVDDHDISEIQDTLLEQTGLSLDAKQTSWLFYECFNGYRGLYNKDFLTKLRIEYLNYLKEIIMFCAPTIAANLDPVNSKSNFNGYDDLAYDLSREWGNNENADVVILGPNGYNDVYYHKVARANKKAYFYANNYDDFLNHYGADFTESVNMRYIQRRINAGNEFWFCADPRTAPMTTAQHKEYVYLYNHYNNQWGSVLFKQDADGFWKFFNPNS